MIYMNKLLYFLILFFLFAVANNLKAEDNKIMSYEEIKQLQKNAVFTNEQWDLLSYLQYRCLDPDEIDCRLNASKKLYESFNSVPNKDLLWLYRVAEDEFARSLLELRDRESAKKGIEIYKKIYNEPDVITDKFDRYNADINFDEAYLTRYARKNTTRVNLAWAYYNSMHGGFKFEEAFKLMKEAADRGLPEGINNLGLMYQEGRAVKLNYKKAFEYYNLAAAKGNSWSHSNIGRYYLLGLGGINKDYNKSIINFKLSTITDYKVDDFVYLNILFNKKKLPKNLKEWSSWVEDYTIRNKDPYGLQELSFTASDAYNFKLDDNLIEEYKWSFLSSKYFPDTGPERHKKLRMEENTIYLEKKVLTEEQVIQARKRAEEWEKKYWNN